MEDQIMRLHLLVEGHVQGVGFRYFVMDKANSMGLTGWVRNTFKSEVEIMAEGERSQLIIFLESVRLGPPMAAVTHVKEEWLDPQGKFQQFSIAHSL
jgi:acylphosphatase